MMLPYAMLPLVNDCLIEKVGNYINNYTIGDDCLISNISVMETTEGATYGEGNLISVLNEVATAM